MINYFAETILTNGGFEDPSLAGWEKFGEGTVRAERGYGVHGQYGCLIAPLGTTYTGIRQGNFYCYPGMPIMIVFWARLGAIEGILELVFEWRTIEGTKYGERKYLYTYNDNDWHPVKQITLADDYATLFSIVFQSKLTNGDSKWLIDSVFIPAIISPRVDDTLTLLTKVV